ncbi:MAG: PTS sugar transporter subunit IIA [Spirochaetales bacterium]|nr:PTS sugar transporter subunit IIA [Spirochaetales bacterium]
MIRTLLSHDTMGLHAQVKDKKAVLTMAAEFLAQPGSIEVETLLQGFLERESLGSTGIGRGLAIPHVTLDGIQEFRIALITIPQGVDFDSIDGKPVQAVFAMVGPKDSRSTHVRILASLSRYAQEKDFLKHLLEAQEPELAMALFEPVPSDSPVQENPSAKSLITVLVQNESYLEPLLEVLAGVAEAQVVVTEGHGAGRYLHSMPLFSMFWTDDSPRTDLKVVTAVIDRHAGNETIRRISTSVADPSQESGLVVTLQDLALVAGRLEF